MVKNPKMNLSYRNKKDRITNNVLVKWQNKKK